MSSRKFLKLMAVAGAVALGCASCTPKRKTELNPLEDPMAIARNPLPPEEAQELIADMGENFLYGNGLGDAAINTGAAIVFPPYAVYLVGNAILSASGYEPVYISDALPEEPRQAWERLYDSVSSAPGRVSAAIAGKEYRTKERINQDMQKYIKRIEQKPETGARARRAPAEMEPVGWRREPVTAFSEPGAPRGPQPAWESLQ